MQCNVVIKTLENFIKTKFFNCTSKILNIKIHAKLFSKILREEKLSWKAETQDRVMWREAAGNAPTWSTAVSALLPGLDILQFWHSNLQLYLISLIKDSRNLEYF